MFTLKADVQTMKHRDELRKLHETGRLQRALGIPLRENNIHPYLTHYARTSDTTTARRPPSDITAPSPKPRRDHAGANDGGGGMGAIMVDDDEVDEFDSDSDFADDMDMDDDASGSEEGEIVETFPNGKAGRVQQKDRFASVSEDEEENEETVFNVPNTTANGKKGKVEEDEEEVESRYGLGKKPTSTYRPPKLSHSSLLYRNDPGGDSSDSDDSIVAIETPARVSTKGKSRGRDGDEGDKPKLDPKDRQAFWAAKGQNQVIDFVDSDDE